MLRVGGIAAFTIRCGYHDDEEGKEHAGKLLEMEQSGRWRKLAQRRSALRRSAFMNAVSFISAPRSVAFCRLASTGAALAILATQLACRAKGAQ